MRIERFVSFETWLMIILSAFSLSLAGCGGNGLSSQIVSGVVSAGIALSGQVSLKDASTTPKMKTTVIGSDGLYAMDVTDMKAPFIIEAIGRAGVNSYTLHSFADGPGTANVNPLSEAAVANASGGADPALIFKNPDMDLLNKISSQLYNTVTNLMAKIQPLIKQYGAENMDPIGGQYSINHLGLDAMFDSVKITLTAGILTFTDVKTGTDIFSGNISDMANWNFPSNPGALPTPPVVPTAPTSFTAAGGAGQVTLTWTSVSNATSYNIYYAQAAGVTTSNGTKIAGVTTSYVHNALGAGVTYYYIVTAINSGGESAPSTEVSAATTVTPPPPPPVPAAPTGLVVTGGTKQVTLSWPTVAGAISYNIYWSTTSGVTTANGTKISDATSPAVQTGLNEGTTYFYIVTAMNGSGESAPSAQVAATILIPTPPPIIPAVPTGLTATGGASQVTLVWSTASGATSYNIYFSTTSGAGTGGTKIAGVTSPYVQTGLSAGTAYYYVVTAQNSVGESGASNEAGTATNAPSPVIPAAPNGVSATGGGNQITLSWSPVSGATSYNIYWSTTAGTSNIGTKISGATTPYILTGLTAGTTYYYVVTAMNAAGESVASAQASATTNAAPPTFNALAYYNTVCLGCHVILGPRSATDITSAIATVGAMSQFLPSGATPLTAAQIAAIAAVSH